MRSPKTVSVMEGQHVTLVTNVVIKDGEQIINSEHSRFKRFNVTVTDSTVNRANESCGPIVGTPLLNRENMNEVEEQPRTSSV
ncbi:hypothetical protein Q8A67_005691 [Cirrhinus molitorella]|uniref:Uncharacterized protein n=1 Tax=Cirrhinus molitorella TaxID=172907 RepID=A0AA88PZF6_9TELE|nr:hypothetical protein Q8A67_005691 [Cirrhinus molitorella]